MFKPIRLALAVCLLISVQVSAAVFIVPDDRELTQKSAGIVTGVVLDSVGKARPDGHIETFYKVRIERVLKGDVVRDSVIEIASPGGNVGRKWMAVPGSAHFSEGDKVLLFLIMDRGTWTPTDMTLGKFRFVTSTGGQSLLVRDAEDIVGFDKEMRTHVERVRREAEFLTFLEETIRGHAAEPNYFVAPGEVVSLKDKKDGFDVSANAFTAASYAIHFLPGPLPGRWADVVSQYGTPIRMSASVARPFFKSTQQSASGLGDGGVAMITDSLNAWIADCGSYVNTPYGGTNGLLRDPDDEINTVVWNDPIVPGQDPPDTDGNIPGSWTGSGVVATAFLSGDDYHTFDGMTNGWISISDSDVVVQNGLTGAESFVDTAMVHEVGHGIGLRHSNTHHDGTACQGSDECTGTAIMNSSVVEALGYTPQTWDINAIRALYPTSCVSPPGAPTGVTATATGTSSVSVAWNSVVGATNYKVFRRAAGGSFTQIGTSPTAGYTDSVGLSANSAYLYKVLASNAGGDSGDSNIDLTTTIVFTDPNLSIGTTAKLVHFNELRTAVNAVRSLASLSAFNFTSPAPATTVTVRKAHVDDLRLNLAAARLALALSTLSFTDSTITAGTTALKAIHVTELRSGVL